MKFSLAAATLFSATMAASSEILEMIERESARMSSNVDVAIKG